MQTHEIDLHVQGAQRDDVGGCLHQTEEVLAGKKSEEGQKHAADQGGGDGRLDGLADSVVVTGADGVSNDNARTRTQTDEHTDDESGEHARGAYGGNVGAAAE